MLKTIRKSTYFMISNTELISSQCYFKIETTQLIFYTNSLVGLYMNITIFRVLFVKLISGSDAELMFH